MGIKNTRRRRLSRLLFNLRRQNHFIALTKRIDSSKTRVGTTPDKLGQRTEYYDSKGNLLYFKNHYTNTGASQNGITSYGFIGADGNQIAFWDHDSDGNIDRMDYLGENGRPVYQAFDDNDDGTFDRAMRNTGNGTGQSINLKS